MFYAEISVVQGIAHLLVGFLFITAGLHNLSSKALTQRNTEQIAALGLPVPGLVLRAGYALQIGGGTMVLLNWHADIGAVGLIVFTIAAQITFHRYWTMTDPLRRIYHRLLLLNNCGVLGGLLLIAEPVLFGL